MKKKLNKIAKDINIYLKKYFKSQKKTDLILPIMIQPYSMIDFRSIPSLSISDGGH